MLDGFISLFSWVFTGFYECFLFCLMGGFWLRSVVLVGSKRFLCFVFCCYSRLLRKGLHYYLSPEHLSNDISLRNPREKSEICPQNDPF